MTRRASSSLCMAIALLANACLCAEEVVEEPKLTVTEQQFNTYVYGGGVLILRLNMNAANGRPAAANALINVRPDAGAVVVDAPALPPGPAQNPAAPVKRAVPLIVQPPPANDVRLQNVADARPVLIEGNLGREPVSVDSRTAAGVRKRFTDALAEEIAALEKFCQLSPSQKRKLDLAGRGDIKQFFDRADELHARYVDQPLTAKERSTAITEMRTVGVAVSNGLLGDDSLFRKTLRQTLSESQREGYKRLLRDREITRLEPLLADWDKKALDITLTPDSRKQLAGLLVDHSNPLGPTASREYWVLTLQIATLQRDDLRPLFAESEWPALERELQEATLLEPTLRAQNKWPIPPRLKTEDGP